MQLQVWLVGLKVKFGVRQVVQLVALVQAEQLAGQALQTPPYRKLEVLQVKQFVAFVQFRQPFAQG